MSHEPIGVLARVQVKIWSRAAGSSQVMLEPPSVVIVPMTKPSGTVSVITELAGALVTVTVTTQLKAGSPGETTSSPVLLVFARSTTGQRTVTPLLALSGEPVPWVI